MTVIERFLIAALLSAMVALSFLQVILRLFFSSGILWADVLLRHLVLAVGFLGAGIASSGGSHFAIDLLKKSLPEKLQKPVHWLIHLAACIVLFQLCGAALRFFKDDADSRSVLFTVGTVEFLSSWINVMIPLGFGLLLIHFALSAFSQPSPEESARRP